MAKKWRFDGSLVPAVSENDTAVCPAQPIGRAVVQLSKIDFEREATRSKIKKSGRTGQDRSGQTFSSACVTLCLASLSACPPWNSRSSCFTLSV